MQDWDDLIAIGKKALQANPAAPTIEIPASLMRRIVRSTAVQASAHPEPDAKAIASVKTMKRGKGQSKFMPPEGHA